MAGSAAGLRLALAMSGTVLVLAGTGCTGTGDEAPAPAAPPPAAAPADQDAASLLPAAPTTTPAATAGALTAQLLPLPAALGPGWRSRIEGSDEEEGVGNGTAFQQRDAREVVQTVLPMGCERRLPSPVPLDVLQSTYAHPEQQAFAVALRLRFPSPAEAAAFADILEVDLGTCRDQPDDPYSGEAAPVVRVSPGDAGYVSEYRLVGEEDVWTKAVRVEGSDVLTLDSDAPAALVDWRALGYPSA
jgi:hypothetical protein